MAELDLAAYRFSIQWPKVLPQGRGRVLTDGLDFYDRLVDALLEHGITPLPTLYHWDLPQALQDDGGWCSRPTAVAFADYAEVVVDRLGDRIATWMTLNEPYVSAWKGHVAGRHAPGVRDLGAGLAAAHHLLLAHGLAVERIRSMVPGAEVGIVLNFTPTEPATSSRADRMMAELEDAWRNRWYIDPIRRGEYPAATVEALGWSKQEVRDGDLHLISAPVDVLGVNYYTRDVISAVGQELPFDTPRTEMGWEIHPESLTGLLVWLHDEYALPKIVITENGCAMPDAVRVDGRVHDPDRIDFLRRHLVAVADARSAGVPVAGYLAWSLMDNFEWAHGYAKRFGLVEIEPGTLRRIPKSSALWFAEVARTGSVPAA